MKLLIPFAALIFIGCDNNSIKEHELSLKERELELREKELEKNKNVQSSNITLPLQAESSNETFKTNVIPQKSKKFVYIVLKAKQPTLYTIQNEQNSTTDANGHYVALGDRYSYKTIMEMNYYTSEVIQLDDYTKDNEYNSMDKFEFQIQEKIEDDDRHYRSEVDAKVLFNRDSYYEQKSQVIARKAYVFDTYEQASINRRKNIHL